MTSPLHAVRRLGSTRPRLAIGNRLLAAIVLGAALVNAAFALALTPHTRLDFFDPSTVIDDRVWAAAVAAVFVPLAWGILRRRHGAWVLLVAASVVLVAIDVVVGEPPTELLLPVAVLAGLLVARRRLVAEPYARTLRRQMLPTVDALARTRALVEAHATDSMAPFKVRSDVGHLFSAAGDAVLAFRVENRALLVAGDPIGTPDGVLEVIQDARRLARGAGLRFGIVAASQELSDRLRAELGMRPIYLGCEAIVATADFSLEGRRIKKVRQAHARVQREGYRLERIAVGDLTPADRAALAACQERSRAPQDEQSFAMAPEAYDAPGSERSVVVLARHAEDGHVAGFMVFMPLARRPIWSLALQLRDPDSPNGVIDALIVHAIQCAQAEGVAELSLNFAAGRRYAHEPVSGFWPRVARVLALVAAHVTQIDNLRAHNDKFAPTWEPRTAIVEHVLEVPHLLFALIWQEGQLPRPDGLLRPVWPQPAAPQPA